MKTITIRDLRQRWLEAEAALQVEQVEDEILITRDSRPRTRRREAEDFHDLNRRKTEVAERETLQF